MTNEGGVDQTSRPGPQTAAERGPDHDRRVNLHMRGVFEAAYQVVVPFLDPKQCWSGMPLGLYAHHALRQSFPELTEQEIAILLSALQRVYCLRQGAVAADDAAPELSPTGS